MRTHFLFLSVLLALAVVTSTARADGLPVLTESGPTGLVTANGAARYATLKEAGGTVVLRVARDEGRVFASGFLHGDFAIPVVAYDGSAGGLSADGSTLVLLRPRTTFPRTKTPFAILDAKSLRVRSVTTLRGDFSFDALSPDGSTLYFIEYLSPDDPTQYAVRAFDTGVGELVREPIVDRTEPDEDMGGNPLSRETSPDGRWAYTLYDGAGSAPFVHALDTVAVEAHCIDLDALAGRGDLPDLRLRLGGGGRLAVVDGAGPVVLIDRATFRVSEPGAPPASHGDRTPWASIGGGIAALVLAGGGIALARIRRRPALT
jgi:hypothetical protein